MAFDARLSSGYESPYKRCNGSTAALSCVYFLPRISTPIEGKLEFVFRCGDESLRCRESGPSHLSEEGARLAFDPHGATLLARTADGRRWHAMSPR